MFGIVAWNVMDRSSFQQSFAETSVKAVTCCELVRLRFRLPQLEQTQAEETLWLCQTRINCINSEEKWSLGDAGWAISHYLPHKGRAIQNPKRFCSVHRNSCKWSKTSQRHQLNGREQNDALTQLDGKVKSEASLKGRINNDKIKRPIMDKYNQ